MASAIRPTCLLIATGGTIAMRLDPQSNAPVPALSGREVLNSVVGLPDVANVEVHNLFNVPSAEIGPESWRTLHAAVASGIERDDIAGVIVSHGTDTLEESAWFLDLTIAARKPIVLVGAQRNASEPDFDGPRNILSAARICSSPDACDKGVLVAMNNQINAARDVTKSHTFDAGAFRSGDAGLLGTVEDDRVVFCRVPTRRQHLELLPEAFARVEIVSMFGGADGQQVRAAVQADAQGIVVQALGAGNVNGSMYQAIQEAVSSGIRVVISTRVHRGRVRPTYGFVGGGNTLQRAGAIFADDLSPQKARILLMLALQSGRTPGEIQSLFDR